ncbi:hypothetical protein BKA81DRAFT_111330 [Phyllosticta paracitricarpa]
MSRSSVNDGENSGCGLGMQVDRQEYMQSDARAHPLIPIHCHHQSKRHTSQDSNDDNSSARHELTRLDSDSQWTRETVTATATTTMTKAVQTKNLACVAIIMSSNPTIFVSVRQPVTHPSIHPSIHPSDVRPFVCLFACLSNHEFFLEFLQTADRR